VKRLASLGEKERALVEERLQSGYCQGQLTRFGGELEPQLRALIGRLVPGVKADIDLAAFVDAHVGLTLGRGDRAPGVPPASKLIEQGLRMLDAQHFEALSESDQDALVARMRRGEADAELGVAAKEFVDRLLSLVLAGYLAHPATWERIGFNGPAYPDGYAWISGGAAAKRHARAPGADRL
jgi:Gluconate 2-dehydrogenase subunit 3